MKKHWIVLVVLTLGLVLGSAFAGSRRSRRPLPPPRPSPVRNCMSEIGLTQDQIDAMEAIRQAAVEALKEVETRQEARYIIQQMRLDIQAVFTEEQLAALAECRQPKRFVTCMDTIGLTQDQIEAIDAIRQAAMEALKEAESPQEARDIIEQMHQAVEDVLTEEQLEALRECLRPKRPVNCMDQIGLTQEQIDAMDAIRELAMQAVQEAQSRQEVREILDQMREDVMAVLTDEQLAALQECRDAHRPRCRRRPEPEPEG
jgi:Spy/CpxP family protein refolding chaperone